MKKFVEKKSKVSESVKRDLENYNLWIAFVEENFEELLSIAIKRNFYVSLRHEKSFSSARKKTLFFLAKEAHEQSWLLSETLFYYLQRFAYSRLMTLARQKDAL